MAKGTKTGGRKAGVPNKATAARQEEVASSGLTPLDFLLTLMRDETADRWDRMAAARAAAPYVHPALKSIELGGKDGNRIVVEIVDGLGA